MNLFEKFRTATNRTNDGMLSASQLSSFMDNAPPPLKSSLNRLKDHLDQTGISKIDIFDARNILQGRKSRMGESIQQLFSKS